MKTISAVLLISVLVSPCSGAPLQNPLQDIPLRFRGEWNSKLEDCGTGLNDSRLTISARSIEFYESGGPVLAVITDGQTELSVITRLTSPESAKGWNSAMDFELSQNQAVLKDTTGGTSLTRYKCPVRVK